ncbi:MAG: response regulator [Myxococcales bacterium]|nr:response regulator [Myxococcales bacterium]
MAIEQDQTALKALLDEKLKLLIKRERDVHTLFRRLNETYRWMASVADAATRIAAYATPRDGLVALATMMVSELGYDVAFADWAGERASVPSPLSEAVEARILSVARAAEKGETAVTYTDWPDGDALREAFRFLIPSHQFPDDAIEVIVGRGARMAAYQRQDHEPTVQRLERLTGVLSHAFDAIRLKRDLVLERDQLAARVEAATHELRSALAKAEDARAEAEQATRARTQFLANMSHEIRTPMTAILGYADLLLGLGQDRELQVSYLHTIRRSGAHLLQLLDDVLDLARIDSGRLAVDLAPAALPQVLYDVFSMLQVRAFEKGIELLLAFATPLPEAATFDAARLRQILINLVGNAIKFTEAGRVVVTASAEDRHGSTLLTISVDDTGVGVSPDRVDAIFEVFEQGSTGMTRRYGGSGLGLAISRRLAQLMGGDLVLVPKRGPGSRFEVTITVAVEPGTERAAAPAPAIAPADDDGVGHHLRGRVLVVEDTIAIQRVLHQFLVSAGLDVELLASGNDALTRLLDPLGAPIDIVFMDMQMPGLDGYQTTAALRAAGCQLPVVALTAHAMVGDRERCLAAGMDDYIPKPIARGELERVLRTWAPTQGAAAAS